MAGRIGNKRYPNGFNSYECPHCGGQHKVWPPLCLRQPEEKPYAGPLRRDYGDRTYPKLTARQTYLWVTLFEEAHNRECARVDAISVALQAAKAG